MNISRYHHIRLFFITTLFFLGFLLLIIFTLKIQPDKGRANKTYVSSNKTLIPLKYPITGQYGIAAGGDLTYMNQEELNSYFDQLNKLGVTWVRWDLDWSQIQSEGENAYDWTGPDRVAKTALKYRVNSLGIIAYTPTWARQLLCKESDKCAPAKPEAFGKFAGEVAARYKTQGIKYWEIWNEPNIDQFWKPAPDVSSYSTLLKASYKEIKKNNPNAFVLSGGLASAINDRTESISMDTFINNLYKIDTTKDFDAISIHPYSFPLTPSYQSTWNSWQQIYPIRRIMILNGDDKKLIWITEFGTPTGGPGSARTTLQTDTFIYGQDYMTEDSQSTIAHDALNLVSGMRQWIGPFFWYSLKDSGTSKDTPENFYGLLRYDGSKKPAYQVFQSAIKNSNSRTSN
jgi:hypothetical protein